MVTRSWARGDGMFKKRQRVWYVTETKHRGLVIRDGHVAEDLGDVVKLEGKPEGMGYKVYPKKVEAWLARKEMLSFVKSVRGRSEPPLNQGSATILEVE